MRRVTVVGLGRIGGALALALDRKGFQITNVVVRDTQTGASVLERLALRSNPSVLSWPITEIIDTDILILSVRDPEIRGVAENLAARVSEVKVALHTSGSLPSTEMESLSAAGLSIGSLHPLVAVSDPKSGADSFNGAYFCIEGDATAVSAASDIVTALKGNAFTIDTELKPLYHASAVMSAGHVVALFDMAVEALSRCGVEDARRILLPLLASTTANLHGQPTDQALTGSFARGDHEAVQAHIRALKDDLPIEVLETYLLLGRRSLDIAARRGEDASADDDELRNVIKIAKESLQ